MSQIMAGVVYSCRDQMGASNVPVDHGGSWRRAIAFVLTVKRGSTVMSLERMSEEFRKQRAKRRTLDLATITVKRVDLFAGQFRFSGRVLIDRQRLGYLVGGEPVTFDVEPGDHTITVSFGRRPAVLSSPGRAKCSALVSVGAGERAEFACGIRPDVVHLWVKARRAGAIRCAALAVPVGLAGGSGWFLAPYFQEVEAWAVFHLPIPSSLIWLCYRLVSRVFTAFWFAMLARWIVSRLIRFPLDQTDEVLLSRIGSPYFLERLDLVGVDE